MTGAQNFVINTGSYEHDQHEIARYQQHYQAQGLTVSAQPQQQGGFLVSVYPPAAATAYAGGTPGMAAQPQQYAAPIPQADAYAAMGQAAAVPPTQRYAGPASATFQAVPQAVASAAQGFGQAATAAGAPAQPAAVWQLPQAQPGFGAPVPQPAGPLGHLSLGRKILVVVMGLFAVGVGGWGVLMMRQAQANIVLFENGLNSPGELSLNGKSYGSIAPKQSLRVELDAGSYTVSFSGNGSQLDTGALKVPATPSSMGSVGYRAVYNVGGKKGLAVVTKLYGTDREDSVEPVPEGKRVVELPRSVQTLERVDETFPESISVPKNMRYGSVVKVCHIDEAAGSVGCPGW